MSRTAAKSNRVIATLKTGAKVAATMIFLLVGFAFVGIAGAINYHASASQGEFWAYAAIGTTILTAALIKASMLLFMRRMYAACGLATVLALPFLALSWITASGNVASADKHMEEVRTAHHLSVTSLSDRRKDAVDRRNAAKAEAGGETEQSALNKIDRIKFGCRKNTRYVCDEIAALKVKGAAAKAYAKAVEEIADIDAKSSQGTVAAQSTSAGAGATVVAFAAQLGHKMNDEDGAKAFEWGRGGGLELAAAIGPSVAWLLAWLLFWAEDDKAAEAPKPRAFAPMSEPKPKVRARLASVLSRITSRRKEAAEIITFPAGSAREFYRRYLEPSDDPKARIPAGAVQSRFAADCASCGVEVRSKTFSQELQALGIRHVKISGRPYYYGVKFRNVPLPAAAHQGPRVVVDNTWKKVAPAPAAALI